MSKKKKKTKFAGVFLLDDKEGTNYFIRCTFNCPLSKRTFERNKVVYGVNLVEAENIRINLYKDLKEEILNKTQTNHRISNKTFIDFSKWYFKFVIDNKIRSEGTVKRDKSICNTMIFPLIGDHKLHSLTREHIRWWLSEVQNLRRNEVELYSENSFKKAFRLLKAMMNTALREGIITQDITSNIRVKFNYGNPPKQKDSLTFEEVDKLLEVSASDIMMNCYISLGVSCGMRVGELTSLTWDDICFDNNTISVCKSYSVQILQNKVKNGRNFTLPLPNLARERLLKLKDKTKGHYNPLNLVFKSKVTNKYLSPTYLNRKLKKYCKDAGIDKNISNHSLRYTCNSLMFVSGINPLVIQKILNHKSGDLISYNYISLDDEVKKDLLDNIWTK